MPRGTPGGSAHRIGAGGASGIPVIGQQILHTAGYPRRPVGEGPAFAYFPEP